MDIEKFEALADATRQTGADIFTVPLIGQDLAYGAIDPQTRDPHSRVHAMNILSRFGLRVVGIDEGVIYFEDPAVTNKLSNQ